LMVGGEVGNFLAYGWAPATVSVSSLYLAPRRVLLGLEPPGMPAPFPAHLSPHCPAHLFVAVIGRVHLLSRSGIYLPRRTLTRNGDSTAQPVAKSRFWCRRTDSADACVRASGYMLLLFLTWHLEGALGV
jgi:hypothetical protein